MDLSLRDLAERSGVSAPMLSQVERGETSPTLAVASRIANGLELTLSQLLRLDEADNCLDRAPRATAGAVPRRGPQATAFEILTPPLPGQRAELSRHELAPRRTRRVARATRRCTKPASREIAVVELGTVNAAHSTAPEHELAHRRHRHVRRGRTRHRFENPGPGDAVLLAVVSAGLRRS